MILSRSNVIDVPTKFEVFIRLSLAYYFSFFVLISAACSDTVDGGTECLTGQKLNPITNLCESDVRGNNGTTGTTTNNPPNNNNTTNNRNNATTTASCTDCAVELTPARLDFEYTPVLESSNANITLKSNVDTPITISSITFQNGSDDEFSLVGLNVGDVISGLAVVSGNILFSPQNQDDDNVTLTINFEGIADPARVNIKTKLTGAELCSESCPRIQVSPRQVAISYQPTSPPIQQTIVLGSVGQANIEIHEILLVQQGAAYSITHDALPIIRRPGESANLDLSFNTAVGGGRTGEILIRSNDPFTPEVKIPVSATTKGGSQDPCINVTPTTLNFGSHQRGQITMRNFAITNCGIGDLNIGNIQRGRFFGIPTSAAFQLTGWTSGIIPTGQTQLVDMSYNPGRAGFDNGSFDVLSDASASPSVRVNVRGVSQTPPLATQDIHIEVSWDSDQTDVDTHVLLLPGNQAAGIQGLWCDNDCYFSKPEPEWGVAGDWEDNPFLDRDDVDGYGPENVNIAKGIDNMKYRVVLHYYDDSQGDSGPSDSNVTVKLFLRGVLQQTWGPLNLGSTGHTKDVFEIAWPSKTITTFSEPIYRAPRTCQP